MSNEHTPETILRAAEAAHEINRIYCESHGDNSQPRWAKAPEWQRKSAAEGVQQIADEPGTTPESSHESWLASKEADGWVYGSTKDPERLTPAWFPTRNYQRSSGPRMSFSAQLCVQFWV